MFDKLEVNDPDNLQEERNMERKNVVGNVRQKKAHSKWAC